MARRLDRRSWLLTRLVVVATVPLLGWLSDAPVPAVAVGGLALWVLVSSWPRSTVVPVIIDVLVAGAIVYASGEVVSPYVLYVVAAVAGAGLVHGGAVGAGAGAVVSAARLASLASASSLTAQPIELLVPSLTVFPLAGLAAGMTVEVLRRNRSGRAVLLEANRLLVDLHRVTDALPGGLDVDSVCEAALAEIRSIERPALALVFSGEGDLLRPVAPVEFRTTLPFLHAGQLADLLGPAAQRLCTSGMIRERIGELGDAHPHWLVVPLRSRGSTVGAFVVGYDDVGAARRARRELVALADETALALDNARLLGATTTRAADVARRRIAHDLHDSVAQSLAHLKMELELLTLTAGDEAALRVETTRLARVAGRALEDVRATITGLRTHVIEDGLVPALRAHVQDLQAPGGPKLSFESLGGGHVDPAMASDVFRVAQEAVSNAVRHARARTVAVSLEIDEDTIELVVEDDGIGLGGVGADEQRRGIGLRAMRARAIGLGGEVSLRPRVGGGTVVVLRCPTRGLRTRPRQPSDGSGSRVRR